MNRYFSYADVAAHRAHIFTAIVVLFVSFLTLSCGTRSNDISPNLTWQELVQQAQNATDRNEYKKAEIYYNTILERFPFDNEAVCGARYEIAFIHYKQKKWDQSRSEFLTLLERYEGVDSELLPEKYKILSNIVLKKIEPHI
ncbi:MAG: hypothetical protein Ta2B_28080 [Termitinemataceae bacterium]|nr:MAG: hypothetical protein Ta2B_28080 [Termitinemataceae bacterium]